MTTKQTRSALANMIEKMNTIESLDSKPQETTTTHSIEKEKKKQFFDENFSSSNFTDNIRQEAVLLVDPHDIANWEYHDRPENEIGDIEALTEEFKTIGQQQPCIIRPSKDNSQFKYEIIAGQRRWMAAKKGNIHLKAIVKNLDDDEAAICQASENSNRKDLSDYAKGMSYFKLVERKIITREELQNRLRLSKSLIRNYLSFGRVKQEIWDAIEDPSKISATTAYELSRLQSKGAEYLNAIIKLAPKLRSGKIGHTRLEKLIHAEIKNLTPLKEAEEVFSEDRRHIFTWRNDTNGNRSITFPKSTRESINFKQLEFVIGVEISRQFDEKKQSARNLKETS